MPAHGIIEPVDISGDGIFGLKAWLEAGAPDQFRFDRFEQSFHHGIVIAIALATHRNDETVPVEDSLVIIGAILGGFNRSSQHPLGRLRWRIGKDVPVELCLLYTSP